MASSPPLPVLPWDSHLTKWRWRQGEHVTLIGPTGAGKTTLARSILPSRTYTLVLATKPKDPLLRSFHDHRLTRTWPAAGPRIILWPRIERTEDIDGQRAIIRQVLRDVYRAGGWTLYLDECRYITEYLGLGRTVELLWIQGRSMGVTVVASAQRPRHLPLAAYSQASHLYVWPTRDRADLRRLQEMGGGPSMAEIEGAMRSLDDHACLYLSNRGDMWATRVEE